MKSDFPCFTLPFCLPFFFAHAPHSPFPQPSPIRDLQDLKQKSSVRPQPQCVCDALCCAWTVNAMGPCLLRMLSAISLFMDAVCPYCFCKRQVWSFTPSSTASTMESSLDEAGRGPIYHLFTALRLSLHLCCKIMRPRRLKMPSTTKSV